MPRLPHICKRNTATTFIRQIPATLQVTQNRTLGLEGTPETLQAKSLLQVSTMRPRAGEGHAHESKSYSPGPAGEPESLHFHSYLLHAIQLATGRHSPTCLHTSECQPEFSVFVPTVTVPEKYLYIMGNTSKAPSR